MALFDNPARVIFEPGCNTTGTATVALTSGHAVKVVTGGTAEVPNLAVADAGTRPYGFAAFDAPAGETVTVITAGEVELPAGADITLGQNLAVGPAGTVVPQADTATTIAVAKTDAASGAPVAAILL